MVKYSLKQPESVLVFHQSIVEHPEDFMDPEPSERPLVLHGLLLDEQHTHDDTGKVTQIESVVRLGRSGE